MWMRHFKHKKKSQTFQGFKAVYKMFRKDDVVDLCINHHEEIHQLYLPVIREWAAQRGPCKDWTWQQAYELIAFLRVCCDNWLKVETPGVEPSRLRAIKGVSR